MKTPREFAERYMDREIYLPFVMNMSGLLYLPDAPEMSELGKIYGRSQNNRTPKPKKIKLNLLEKELIGADTKGKIYRALYELTQAMIVDIDALKKLNKDFIKKRKDAIGHLEKILRDPLLEKRQVIAEELERLKAFDKNKKPYKEIDFISSWYHIYYAGLLKKLVLKIETKKLSDMLSIPISFKKERLLQFFSAVLQIVIFRYLHEYANIPQKKAERLTVAIINEYIEGDRLLFSKAKSSLSP
jgi:hypothetical protein